MTPRSLPERFWEKVEVGDPDRCWVWTASTKNGYGQIGADGTIKYAHRVSYELEHGEDPGEMHVLHECDNPPCVNPAHLQLGTHSENIRQAAERGQIEMKGEAHPQAKLTENDVVEIKDALDRGEDSEEIGDRYGVTGATIRWIDRGEGWPHVTGGEE